MMISFEPRQAIWSDFDPQQAQLNPLPQDATPLPSELAITSSYVPYLLLSSPSAFGMR